MMIFFVHVPTGALIMACHLKGLNDEEIELLMRAMMFSGELLVWPKEWVQNMASLQSTGSTGNKAKLILAPAMACCGLKVCALLRNGGNSICFVQIRTNSMTQG